MGLTCIKVSYKILCVLACILRTCLCVHILLRLVPQRISSLHLWGEFYQNAPPTMTPVMSLLSMKLTSVIKRRLMGVLRY